VCKTAQRKYLNFPNCEHYLCLVCAHRMVVKNKEATGEAIIRCGSCEGVIIMDTEAYEFFINVNGFSVGQGGSEHFPTEEKEERENLRG
jgi:transcription elongation factor Elf1